MNDVLLQSRCDKGLRTVEDIMEQELAADYLKDNAEASSASVPATMSIDTASDTSQLEEQLQQGLGANQTDDLELCSTSELLDMFEGYYESDKKRLENDFLISETGFHVDLDLDHPALDDPGSLNRPI